jgi:hypothetical protein
MLGPSTDPLGKLALAQPGFDSRTGNVPADKLADQLAVIARYRGSRYS